MKKKKLFTSKAIFYTAALTLVFSCLAPYSEKVYAAENTETSSAQSSEKEQSPLKTSEQELPSEQIETVEINLELTKEQMLEDFDALYQTLKENYPYFGILSRKYEALGLPADYDRISMEESRQTVIDLDMEDKNVDIRFMGLIERFLRDMAGGTSHLNILYPEYFSMIKDTYTQYLPEMQSWADILSDEEISGINNYYVRRRSAFRAEMESAKTEDGGSENAESETAEPVIPQNLELKILEDGETAYINIRSFEDSLREEEVPRIIDFYSQIAECGNLIIDIRENSGGNVAYWMDAIVSPNITEDITIANDFMITDGEVANQFYGKEYENSGITVEDVKNNPDYVNLHKDDLDVLDKARTLSFTVSAAGDEKAFNGKIWLLTSPMVYSASEKLADFCKRTGIATLVGQTTGGEGVGNDPVIYALPNSKVLIRFNVEYCVNADGSCNQEYGTDPDRFSEDALTEVQKIITLSK